MTSFKRNRRRCFWLLTIVWMCLIFAFSSRNAELSTEDSTRVGIWIGTKFVPGFRQWDVDRQMDFAQAIDHPVRKTAHAMEYTVLGICLLGAMYTWDVRRWQWQVPGYAWLAGTCYAMTDEFHQLYVPGRSGQWSDVAIDSAGVLVGSLIMTGVLRYLTFRGRGEWYGKNR